MAGYEGETVRLQPTYPRCGSPLQEGFVHPWPPHGAGAAAWVEGKLGRSWWYGVDWSDREAFQITAYRCRACGYLEFYATDEV